MVNIKKEEKNENDKKENKKKYIPMIKLLDPEIPPKSLEEIAFRKGIEFNTYLKSVTLEEYLKDLEIVRRNWLSAHSKFKDFLDKIDKDITDAILNSKSGEVATSIKNLMEELEKYHMSNTGSMNINSKDLVVGLLYYYADRDKDVSISKDRKHIIFKKLVKRSRQKDDKRDEYI